MPDDQYVLFIPEKEVGVSVNDKNPPKQIADPQKIATSLRATEMWANRSPYVVAARATGAYGTAIQAVTSNGAAAPLILPTPVIDFDDTASYDPATGQFTAKVRALYDFFIHLDFEVIGGYSRRVLVGLAVQRVNTVAWVPSETSSIHLHDFTAMPVEGGDTGKFWHFPGNFMEIGDQMRFQISAITITPPASQTFDVNIDRIFINRRCSIPGSTQ